MRYTGRPNSRLEIRDSEAACGRPITGTPGERSRLPAHQFAVEDLDERSPRLRRTGPELVGELAR